METVILKHYCQDKQTMIGKKKINQIKLLAQKKFRRRDQLFLIEGEKIVLEVLNSRFRIKELYATDHFIQKYESKLKKVESVINASYEEIRKASLQKSPQDCLAICYQTDQVQLPVELSGISFFLDGIQDPGNLGTIIRTADWFGMEYLFCSPDTADFYNPKVIQSSMGSFCRIKILYLSFEQLAAWAETLNFQLVGTFMEGINLYSAKLQANSLIVLGNEGNGIRQEVENKIELKIHIPSFNMGPAQPESLNVAVAAGIIGSEFKRQLYQHSFIQNEN